MTQTRICTKCKQELEFFAFKDPYKIKAICRNCHKKQYQKEQKDKKITLEKIKKNLEKNLNKLSVIRKIHKDKVIVYLNANGKMQDKKTFKATQSSEIEAYINNLHTKIEAERQANPLSKANFSKTAKGLLGA